MFQAIGFDADDTLWHNERLFSLIQSRFREILNAHHPEVVDQTLYATERRNLQYFGYGVKGFVLSMLETAVELTQGEVTGAEIQQIMDFGKEMLDAPLELLPHAGEIIRRLSPSHRLILITKGDLFDQETKIARSGLADHFQAIEIVSEKDASTYRSLLQRHQVDPENFVMVGNSLRSDILPVLEIGGSAIYVPHELTWAHEHDKAPTSKRYSELEHLGQLPDWLQAHSAV
jgi:putative hydrolase of the HAD superfamily